MLFMALDSVHLNDQNDIISWTSAYKCPTMPVWQAKTEAKCKFFAWLALHNKLHTTDNMIKRNWECDEFCSLCLCIQESTFHLLVECNFMEAVWNLVALRVALPSYGVLIAAVGLEEWVQKLLCSGAASEKRRNLGILFMIWWEI
jgi:hypothetical protein